MPTPTTVITIANGASVTGWLGVRNLVPSYSNANAVLGLYVPATTATTTFLRVQARIRSEADSIDVAAIVMDGGVSAGFALPSNAARCGAMPVGPLLPFDEIRFETSVGEGGAAVAQGAERTLVLLTRAI